MLCYEYLHSSIFIPFAFFNTALVVTGEWWLKLSWRIAIFYYTLLSFLPFAFIWLYCFMTQELSAEFAWQLIYTSVTPTNLVIYFCSIHGSHASVGIQKLWCLWTSHLIHLQLESHFALFVLLPESMPARLAFHGVKHPHGPLILVWAMAKREACLDFGHLDHNS